MQAISLNRITQGQHGASKAVDYASVPDINIYAPEDGTIDSYGQQGVVGTENDAGLALRMYGYNGLHQFAHTEKSYVKVGQKVNRGQVIARMGWTGYVIDANGRIGTPGGRHCHWWISTSKGYVYPPNLINQPFIKSTQGGDMITTKAQLSQMYLAILERKRRGNEGEDVYLGKDSGQTFNYLMQSAERARLLARKAADQKATQNQINNLTKQVSDLTVQFTNLMKDLATSKAQNLDLARSVIDMTSQLTEKNKALDISEKEVARLRTTQGDVADKSLGELLVLAFNKLFKIK